MLAVPSQCSPTVGIFPHFDGRGVFRMELVVGSCSLQTSSVILSGESNPLASLILLNILFVFVSLSCLSNFLTQSAYTKRMC